MNQQRTMTPVFYEDAPPYRCPCCCCKCCHIKIACGILAALCLLGAIGSAIRGIVTVTQISDAGSIAFVSILSIIFPILLAISCVLIFVAIFGVKPVLVWPHIIMLVLGMIIALIYIIVIILVITGATNFGLSILKQDPDYERNAANIRHLKDKLTQKEYRSGMVGIGAAYVALFFIACAIQGYIIYLYFVLKRYLTDKSVAMGNKVGVQMQPY